MFKNVIGFIKRKIRIDTILMLTIIEIVSFSSRFNLLTRTDFPYFCAASLAQLVEHLTLNQQVTGSSPVGCTKNPENKTF